MVFKDFQKKWTINWTDSFSWPLFQKNGLDQSMDHGSVQFGLRSYGLNLETLLPLCLLNDSSNYQIDVVLAKGDQGIPAAFVQQGLMPCTPFSPSLTFTTWLLELYRTSHLCCPHLAIQPFINVCVICMVYYSVPTLASNFQSHLTSTSWFARKSMNM